MTQENSSLAAVALIAYLLTLAQVFHFSFVPELFQNITFVRRLYAVLNFVQINVPAKTVTQFYINISVTVILVVIVLFLAIHVAVSFRKGVFTSLWSVKLLRILGLAFLSLLFIPSLTQLIGSFHCSLGSDNSLVLSTFSQESIKCLSFPNSIFIALSVLSLFIIVPFACFLSLVYFSPDPMSGLLSRSHGRYDLAAQSCKILLVVISTFINNITFKLVLFLIVYFSLYCFLIFYQPYYQTKVSLFISTVYMFSITTCIYSLFLKFSDQNLNGIFLFYSSKLFISNFQLSLIYVVFLLIGVLITCYLVLIYTNSSKFVDFRRTVKIIDRISKKDPLSPHLILSLAASHDLSTTSTTTLKDLSWHNSDCLCPNCAFLVGNFRSIFQVERASRKFLKFLSKNFVNSDDPKIAEYVTHCVASISLIFLQGISYFGRNLNRSFSSSLLPLMLSNTLSTIRPTWKSYFESILIDLVDDKNLPLDVKFLLFVKNQESLRDRLTSIREDDVADSITESSPVKNQSMGIVQFLDYQRLLFQANEAHISSLNELILFWKELLLGNSSGNPLHFVKLPQIASNLVEHEELALDSFSMLIDRFPDNPDVLLKAARFIREVQGDASLASKLESSANTLNHSNQSVQGSIREHSVALSASGSVALSSSSTSNDSGLVVSEQIDEFSGQIRLVMTYLISIVVVLILSSFFLQSQMSKVIIDRITTSDQLFDLQQSVSYLTAIGSIIDFNHDTNLIEILHQSAAQLRLDLLKIMDHNSVISSKMTTPITTLSGISDPFYEPVYFNPNGLLHNVLNDIVRLSRSITSDKLIGQGKSILSELVQFNSLFLSNSFETLSVIVTNSFSFSFIFSKILISLIYCFLLICFYLIVKILLNIFHSLNENRASALRLFLEIPKSVTISKIETLSRLAEKHGALNESNLIDDVADIDLTAAAKTNLIASSGASSSASLIKLKNKSIFFSIIILLLCFLNSFTVFRSEQIFLPNFSKFSDTSRLPTFSANVLSTNLIGNQIIQSNLSSKVNDFLARSNQILYGSSFRSFPKICSKPQNIKISDLNFDFEIFDEYLVNNELFRSQNLLSNFHFMQTSSPKYPGLLQSINNDFSSFRNFSGEFFSIYYSSLLFAFASCPKFEPNQSFLTDNFDPLFKSMVQYSESFLSNMIDSLDHQTSFSLGLTLFLFLLLFFLRLFFFSDVKKTVYFDGRRTSRLVKMVPESCKKQTLIQWDKSLEIGVDWVDQQHRKLVEIMNQVYKSAIVDIKSKEVLREALFGLLEYTKTHFACEEEFFKATNYPDTPGHAQFHRKLEGQVLKFYEKFESGQTQIDMSLMTFLRNWLINHILKSDVAYVEHYKSHNYVPSLVASIDVVVEM
ncbi:hypothetical protein RCL1_002152 [Eukaryota sp. TZLM3-RCL]